MTNDTALNLKWKLKLTLELAPGESVERDVTEWKRGEPVDLASLGLSTEEGKAILAGIQTQVTVQLGPIGGAVTRLVDGYDGRQSLRRDMPEC
jgi:hypothetical protein